MKLVVHDVFLPQNVEQRDTVKYRSQCFCSSKCRKEFPQSKAAQKIQYVAHSWFGYSSGMLNR